MMISCRACRRIDSTARSFADTGSSLVDDRSRYSSVSATTPAATRYFVSQIAPYDATQFLTSSMSVAGGGESRPMKPMSES